MKKIFEWAFNAGLTRFVQKEFSLKMGNHHMTCLYYIATMMPVAECHNHKPHEDTVYRVVDPEGKILREFTETTTLEPWGTADFEYFYSRPLASIQENRRKQLFVSEEVINRLEEESIGNMTQIEEADKEHVTETYQIITARPMKKGE